MQILLSVCVVALTLMLPSIPLQKRPPSGLILRGNYPVGARNHAAFAFEVLDRGKNASLQGQFQASGGANNDIECYVFDYENFESFVNQQPAESFYDSGRVSLKRLNVELAPGLYYLVFNNRFSNVSSKNVRADIGVVY